MSVIKPWYLSRTIWASAVVVVAALAGLLGFAVDDAEIDLLVDALLQTAAALAGVFAIFARIIAKARIG